MICVVGMPGSGKSIFVEEGKRFGFKVLNMGDFVRRETLRRGFPVEEHGKVAKLLRKERGDSVVAKLVLEKIEDEKTIVDGIRSLHEVEEFRKKLEVFVVAIHSPPRVRFERLKARKREGDPESFDKFRERDFRELEFGIGNVIALADKMILNDKGLTEFREKCKKFFEEFI